MLKDILKLNGAQKLSKIEQKSIEGGLSFGTFRCEFGGVCFDALNEYHCVVQLGLQPCSGGGLISL